jgi:hypothetical protein
MEDKMMGMRVNLIEGMQACIQSNVEPKRKLVAAMVLVIWREGEIIRRKPEESIVSQNGLVSLIS